MVDAAADVGCWKWMPTGDRDAVRALAANLALSSWTKLLTSCSRVASSCGLANSSTGERDDPDFGLSECEFEFRLSTDDAALIWRKAGVDGWSAGVSVSAECKWSNSFGVNPFDFHVW